MSVGHRVRYFLENFPFVFFHLKKSESPVIGMLLPRIFGRENVKKETVDRSSQKSKQAGFTFCLKSFSDFGCVGSLCLIYK